MRLRLAILLIIIGSIISLNSCKNCVFFECDEYEYLDENLILNYKVDDIVIYTMDDKSKIDTFRVTSSFLHWNGDPSFSPQTYTQTSVCRMSTKENSINFRYFDMNVFPESLMFLYGTSAERYNEEGISFIFDQVKYDTIINEAKYSEVYLYENDTGGESDSILNKLVFTGGIGIVGYRFENGDEYLLDTIIKVED